MGSSVCQDLRWHLQKVLVNILSINTKHERLFVQFPFALAWPLLPWTYSLKNVHMLLDANIACPPSHLSGTEERCKKLLSMGKHCGGWCRCHFANWYSSWWGGHVSFLALLDVAAMMPYLHGNCMWVMPHTHDSHFAAGTHIFQKVQFCPPWPDFAKAKEIICGNINPEKRTCYRITLFY